MNPQVREENQVLDPQVMMDGAFTVDQEMDQEEDQFDEDNIEGFDPHSVDFYQNLAELLPDSSLTQISEKLLDAIDEDLDSREEWESSIKDGLSLLGIKRETKTFPFDGASGVYSPVFMQAALTFTANARSELLPLSGPCKIDILGEETSELSDRSKRIESYVNYYLTQVDKDFYSEMEKAFLWGCLVGSIFVKVYKHPILNRPTIDRIMPQDFIVAQNTKSLDTSPRLTQCLYLNKKEIRERQLSGFYRDIKVSPLDTLESDEDDIQSKVDSMSGISHDSMEFEDEFVLYECHADLDIEGLEHTDESGEKTGIPMPYIVTIDKNSRKILSIYRNWREDDRFFKRISHFVDFTYLPGLDFWGWGLVHIAGGCAQAATSLLRQIQDALTLSNFPGGMRVKGMRLEDNNIRVGPTEFIQIDTGGLPIQQAIMPMPYKDPSPIAMQLKKEMEDNILNLSAISNIKLDDISSNMPVGTIYALIEQTSKPQSAIMQRFHGSFGKILKIMFRLFAECLPDEPYFFKSQGADNAIMRQDFHHDIDIIPASDPNLSSSTQRLVRSETILKLAQQAPQLHNLKAIYNRIYRDMGVDNIDEILISEQQVVPLDPVTENMNMMKGSPAKAGIDQDHNSHIATHSLMIADPNMQQQFPNLAPAVKSHIQEHVAMQYMIEMMKRMGTEMPQDPSQVPMEVQNQIAIKAAEATQQIQTEMQQALQAQQPPAVDPTQVVLADMKQRHEYEQSKLQLEMEKLKLKEKENETNVQIKLKEMEQKDEIDKRNREAELLKEEMKQQPIV